MTRVLIVRMSALGDIVHALPVLAAVRAAHPDASVDWLADTKYGGVLDYVSGVSQRIGGRPRLVRAVRALRTRRYDVALDLQGLLKSAVMARLSGARRVVGFERSALREPAAAWFYSEHALVPAHAHVVRRNLSLLAPLGIPVPAAPVFPITAPESRVASEIVEGAARAGYAGMALVNPGAAWLNKRWSPERFGAVARHLATRHRVQPVVVWAGDEARLADAVVAASAGVAVRAPQTSLGDLLALASRARLMVSGDTGPIHLAAALGTPVVGLYGPTWPERNGPWDPADVVVSRAAECVCHHKRRCLRESAGAHGTMCLDDITVAEVTAAVDVRMTRAGGATA